jgi:hypothetical protein
MGILSTLNYRLLTAFRRLHQLNRGPVGIAHIDNTFPSVRSYFEQLWFAGCCPTRCCNFVQDRFQIIDKQRDVHRPDLARSKIRPFTICRREILKQFDLVTARRLQDHELDFSALDSRDLLRKFTSLMRAV